MCVPVRRGESADQTKRVAPDQEGITCLPDQQGSIGLPERMVNIYPKPRSVSSAYQTRRVAFVRPHSKGH